MKAFKFQLLLILLAAMAACSKDNSGPSCDNYEFEFDYEFIAEDGSSNSVIMTTSGFYKTLSDDPCAEGFTYASTGKTWNAPFVEKGDTYKERLKVSFHGQKIEVEWSPGEKYTVGPNDLLKVIYTKNSAGNGIYDVRVIENQGAGSGGNTGGGNNTGGSNNKTTSVQFKLAEEYGGVNLGCLLPITIEVTEGLSTSKVCQFGDNCFPCGSGFKSLLNNPGKSHGRKTINLNKSGEVACGAGGVAAFDLAPGKYTYEAESQACVYFSSENKNSKGFRFLGSFTVTDRDLDKDCKTITLNVGPLHATNNASQINWINKNCK